jgi:integrase
MAIGKLGIRRDPVTKKPIEYYAQRGGLSADLVGPGKLFPRNRLYQFIGSASKWTEKDANAENDAIHVAWDRQIRDYRKGAAKALPFNAWDDAAVRAPSHVPAVKADANAFYDQMLSRVTDPAARALMIQARPVLNEKDWLAKALLDLLGNQAKTDAERNKLGETVGAFIVQDIEAKQAGEEPIRTAETQPLAHALAVAQGGLTPIASKLSAWLEPFAGNRKDQSMKENAVKQFVKWCIERGNPIDPYFERINAETAVEYMIWRIQTLGDLKETLRKHRSNLGMYWKATKQASNPWSESLSDKRVDNLLKAREEDDGVKYAFSDEQLETLFANSPDSDMSAAMALLLLSGARVAEIFGLRVEDCKEDFFTFRPGELEGRDTKRTLKNDQSIRRVPIPTALRALVAKLCKGKAPGDRLLDESLADGNQLLGQECSKRFTKWKRELFGETVEKRPDGRTIHSKLTLGSMRETWLTNAKGLGVDVDTRNLVTGHSDKKNRIDAKYTGSVYKLNNARLTARLLPTLDLLSAILPDSAVKFLGPDAAKARKKALAEIAQQADAA